MNREHFIDKRGLIDFEARIADRFDNGEIPYLIHLSGGNEEQLMYLFAGIRSGDWVFSTHRSHYHYLLHGGSPEKLENMILSGQSMFVFDKALNFYSSSIVCGSAAIAVGVAWALKKLGSDRMVWCFLGDGAEDEGHLYEAARYVDGWELPCKFIIEDNDRSVNAPKAVRWGKSDKGKQPDCVWRYSYTPTWPHGGTGRNKWLEFKTQAVVLPEPQKQWLNYPVKEDIRDGVRMPYKTAVKQSMEMLARIPNTIFIGYNVRYGSAYGTLADVPEEQRLETPVAENLMAGLAMGMSLLGFKPILFFERHDFIFNAMDALVNQVDKITMITRGEFVFPIIIRAVAGSVKPFYAGLTHTSDLVRLFQHSFYFPVVVPMTAGEVLGVYEEAAKFDRPVLVVEYKELHG